jgi:hypothetical protein
MFLSRAFPSRAGVAHGLSKLVDDLTTLSEDCLTVSIWRPAGLSAKDKVPIVSADSRPFEPLPLSRVPFSFSGRKCSLVGYFTPCTHLPIDMAELTRSVRRVRKMVPT